MEIDKPETQYRSFNRDVLAQEITDHLLEMIREGELGPGDKLPSERDLASMMQVSRPSLREALQALKAHDVDAACAAMASHLQHAENNLRQAISLDKEAV